MATGIKDKVAIIGMGCSKFGERWDAGAAELMREAFDEMWIIDFGGDNLGARKTPNVFNIQQETLSLGPSRPCRVQGLQLDADEILHLPVTHGDEAVIDTATRNRDFSDDTQFITWRM